MDPAPFFTYARERQAVLLRRRAGQSRPWSSDPAFANNRFCNVFREDDRTTIWFRENVRDRLAQQPEVLLATVVFRWFNRITTGEAIFSQTRLDTDPPGAAAWDEFLGSGDTRVLRDAILKHVGYAGPFVTGAYIIKTPNGMDKLDGVLYGIREFSTGYARGPLSICGGSHSYMINWRDFAKVAVGVRGQLSLQETWSWLCQFPYLGPFMAYEVVSDLRYTALLDRAPDIMTWANAGPGATRGLNRIWGRTPIDKAIRPAQQSEEMRQLLECANDRVGSYWPRQAEDGGVTTNGYQVDLPYDIMKSPRAWPAWDMRTVEHTLCEFDKHQRVTLGQGRMKQRFVPHAD